MVPSGALEPPRGLLSLAALGEPPSPEKPPIREPMGEVIVPFVSIILTLAPPASQTYRSPAASKAMALGELRAADVAAPPPPPCGAPAGARGVARGGWGAAGAAPPPSPVVACVPVPPTAETVVRR